jgi:carbon-monoxide dehydrogenase medium subunit
MSLFYRKLPRFDYVRPKTVDEALSILAGQKGGAKLLAGGTDLLPQLRRRETPAPACVIDLKGISGLDGIDYKDGVLRIGPLLTVRAAADSPILRERFAALQEAASVMASPQVRNRGTLAGNICNAVPSADSAPALLVFDAEVLAQGSKGARSIPIDGFFNGPRRTVLASDEMCAGIAVPPPLAGSRSTYLKLSPRHSMDLAVVGVAVWGVAADGYCREVRIALGAVAPTPIRARGAERLLAGRKVTPEAIEEAARAAGTECSPIDDHRASAEYRCDMVYAMTRRALRRVFAG